MASNMIDNITRLKADFVAKVVDSGYFEYGQRCYMKNNHYYIYDLDALKLKPISIKELASQYDYILNEIREREDFDALALMNNKLMRLNIKVSKDTQISDYTAQLEFYKQLMQGA